MSSFLTILGASGDAGSSGGSVAAWVGLAGVLLGAFIAKALDYWNTGAAFRREKRSALDAEARQHLEQVYRLLEDHRQAATDMLLEWSMRLRYQDVPKRSSRVLPWAELKMRVVLYVPELLPQFNALMEGAKPFADALGRGILAQNRSQAERDHTAGMIEKAHGDLVPIYDSFGAAIEQIFRRKSQSLVGDGTP